MKRCILKTDDFLGLSGAEPDKLGADLDGAKLDECTAGRDPELDATQSAAGTLLHVTCLSCERTVILPVCMHWLLDCVLWHIGFHSILLTIKSVRTVNGCSNYKNHSTGIVIVSGCNNYKNHSSGIVIVILTYDWHADVPVWHPSFTGQHQ
jgi:hypothetical protein